MGECESGRGRIWIVSELYYPEVTSTGHIMTLIAEGLAGEFRVNAVCGQPTYSLRGTKAPARENRNGVEIYRCWATTWDKDVLLKRVVNLVTISCSIFFKLLWRLRRTDRVLVVTNPPLLPFFASLACRLRGATCFLLIHDVYPEVAVAAGILRANSTPARILNWFVRRLYLSMEQIIVLGRDMRELVRSKCKDENRRVAVITNWADLDLVYPTVRSENRVLKEAGLVEKFVIQCAGNMGPLHDIESILECAQRLRDHADIHFLMIGSGAKRKWVERTIEERRLTNVTLLPPFPRSESLDYINACDVAISALVPGMLGVSVPSRTYNILAAAKPIIAVTDPGSELARVIVEEEVGWVVPTADVEAMAKAVLEARNSPQETADMARRARAAAETKYPSSRIIRAFDEMFRESGPIRCRAASCSDAS